MQNMVTGTHEPTKPNYKNSELNNAEISGIIGGGIVLFLIIIMTIVFCYKSRRNRDGLNRRGCDAVCHHLFFKNKKTIMAHHIQIKNQKNMSTELEFPQSNNKEENKVPARLQGANDRETTPDPSSNNPTI